MTRRRIGAIAALCALAAAGPAWGTQRSVTAKIHNYKDGPLVIKETTVTLVETYGEAGAQNSPAKGSTVRYANRASQQVSTFILQGMIACENTSSKPIEAIAVGLVLLDPFHERIPLPGERNGFATNLVMAELSPRGSKEITWEYTLRSSDLFEAAVTITRARFKDGTVWTAPPEEVIDIF